MEKYNIFAAWVGILFGILSGIPLGLLFHKTDWLGGYDSWPRRLLRLGHVSFFGIAFLNLAFGYTIILEKLQDPLLALAGQCLMAAQITMPAICFASAFWKPARHLFFIPVASTLGGALGLLWVLKGALP